MTQKNLKPFFTDIKNQIPILSHITDKAKKYVNNKYTL